MIFGFVDILSYVSTFMTLKPGDIICTGTPIKLNQKPRTSGSGSRPATCSR